MSWVGVGVTKIVLATICCLGIGVLRPKSILLLSL